MKFREKPLREHCRYDFKGQALEVEDVFIQDVSIITLLSKLNAEGLLELTKAVEELKVQVARIAKEVKDAVELLAHPDSSDAEVEQATAQLKAAADALEVATAPAEKKVEAPVEEPKAEAPAEEPKVEAPVEAPAEAAPAAEAAPEAPQA